MASVSALSTAGPGERFERTTIERRDLRPHDVRIDIAYAGICHSDIHQARDEWGGSIFPMVPGHEVTGTVAEVGAEVTGLSVGDRVGVGVLVDSCGECTSCHAGLEQHCLKPAVEAYNNLGYDGEPTMGGYSAQTVVKDHFVLRIPDELPLDATAPLLCAGITTYSPLRQHQVGPGKQVAVVGMGGLGHVAVKLAHAMGAEVTVLSQSLSKSEDGAAFGADHYYATSDDATFEELAGTFDLILNTVSADLDYDRYLNLLAVGGSFTNVGAPPKPQSMQVFSLITNGRSIDGSKIGGLAETQQMLDFCAEHGVTATIETIAAEDVDKAYDRVVDSDVRYRFVIDASTLAS